MRPAAAVRRQRDAALAYHASHSHAGSAGFGVKVREPRGTLDVGTRRIGAHKRDIGGDRCREQERLLRHPRDLAPAASPACSPPSGVHPSDGPCPQRVMPQQEMQQRRLARAGRPDDAERCARSQRERTRRRSARSDRSAGVRRYDGYANDTRSTRSGPPAASCVPVVVDRKRFAQQRLEPGPGRLAAFDQRQHPARREHRPDELAEIHREGGELCRPQLLAPQEPATHARA